MGTVRKPSWTRPLPTEAKVTETRNGRIAHWTDKWDKLCEGRVIERRDGSLGVRITSSIYHGRYRRADGRREERSTGCTNKLAAQHVLQGWEAEEDRIRSGHATRAEVDARDEMTRPFLEHLQEYLDAPLEGRKANRRSARRLKNVEADLTRLAADCSWHTLSEVNAPDFRRWLEARTAEDMSPARRSGYLAALKAMLNWCVRDGRCPSNPISEIATPRHEDRRKPRAFGIEDMEQLLAAAYHRPLHDARLVRTGPRKGQLVARVKPERAAELSRTGWGRALLYKTMALTGLRTEEAAAMRVGDLDLDEENPTLFLDGARTKNGEAALVALRGDLALEIGSWLDHLLESRREEFRAAGKPIPTRLDPEDPLFPAVSWRVFRKDLEFADIDLSNRRGHVACRRSLRRTGCTMLTDAGASQPIVSAWMRHKGDTLAERAYTDRELLDIRRWLDRLPPLPLPHDDDSKPPEALRATGTEGIASPILTQTLAHTCLQTQQEGGRMEGGASASQAPAGQGIPPKGGGNADEQGQGMERLKRFELSTSTLARLRSTTELQPLSGSEAD